MSESKDDRITPDGKIGSSWYDLKYFAHKYALIADYAASKENTKFYSFLGVDVGLDALKQEWVVNGFCHPPLSLQDSFLEHGYGMVVKHGITLVYLVKVEDTLWNKFLVAGEVRSPFVLDSRIKRRMIECGDLYGDGMYVLLVLSIQEDPLRNLHQIEEPSVPFEKVVEYYNSKT